MPPRHAVSTLPDNVRNELHKRLVLSNFGDYDGLALWLSELGYNISKSSLGRYGQRYQAGIVGSNLAVSEAADDDKAYARLFDARLRCIEAASHLPSSTDPKALIKAAEELLVWLYSPTTDLHGMQ